MRQLKFVQEIWKECPGYEESYQVSNYGQVRSIDRTHFKRRGRIKGKILIQILNKKGYPEVKPWKDNKQEARNPYRLVALAFIPNPDNLPQVNHINGNKLNNCVWNLEWASNSDNQKHAYKLGLQPSRAGENNSNSKITDKQVSLVKFEYNHGAQISMISDSFKIPIGIIRNIIYGRTWKSNKIPILKRDDRSKTKKPILCEI